MEILDKNFLKLPAKRKAFVFIIGICFFLIAIIAYLASLASITEMLLIIVIGILFTELIKLNYRLENIEKKKVK